MYWRRKRGGMVTQKQLVLILLLMDYVLEVVFKHLADGLKYSLNPSSNGLCIGGCTVQTSITQKQVS